MLTTGAIRVNGGPRQRNPSPRGEGAAAEEDGLGGVEEDGEVEEEGGVLDVEEVVLELLAGVFGGVAVGVVDLGPAGYAGFDEVALAEPGDAFR